jgi:adenosine deaminase
MSSTASPHSDPHADLHRFCERLPKAELHAHLNGCIRPSTLDELLLHHETSARPAENSNDGSVAAGVEHTDASRPATSLSECFEMFGRIHQAVTTSASLRRIVAEAIEDFARANVLYVELRTTPRPLGDMNHERDYVDTVVAAIQEHAPKHNITVRLLLSINRSEPVEKAMDTVRLAAEYASRPLESGVVGEESSSICNPPPCVVGVDFSGNPHVGPFDTFKPVFEQARQLGLRIALHFAEHLDPVEAQSIMSFAPDRVGHAVCLSDKSFARLESLRLPIELCLTSNTVTVPELGSCSCCASLPSASKRYVVMDGWMVTWMDGWMNEMMNGYMDGWMDGYMD